MTVMDAGMTVMDAGMTVRDAGMTLRDAEMMREDVEMTVRDVGMTVGFSNLPSENVTYQVLRIPVISPVSSLRSISNALGLDGNPGKVMMLPANVTIWRAPARTRNSLMGSV